MSKIPKVAQLTTAGVIAETLGVSLTRVQYVLRTRPHIKPRARAGVFRLYDNPAIAMVRHELTAIESRRYRLRDAVSESVPAVSESVPG